MVPAIIVPPKLFNMKVLPEVDDALGSLRAVAPEASNSRASSARQNAHLDPD